MKKIFFCIIAVLLLISYSSSAQAVIGIPDQVQSATLIVPLMEKGITSVHNTLIVVDSLCSGSQTIHWEIWDVNGNATNAYGNVTFTGSFVSDFGSILASASPAVRTQLTDGDFYRGFMTIDLVTAGTTHLPVNPLYPFRSANCLTGWIYYVRLLEGAANGIPMVHIEGGLSVALHPNARGLYQSGDDREEIDNHARYYAYRTTRGLSIIDDPDNKLNHTISRVYVAGNGETRIVFWAWGPAAYGTTTAPGDVGGPFPYWYFNEAGVQIASGTLSLNRIVNVIDVLGDINGQIWINDIPENFNVYAFSFNSANYPLNPALTWEAMFESTILPHWLP